MAKKQPPKQDKLTKIITLGGLGLLALVLIASIFGAGQNVRFVNDAWDIVYYWRYLLLLGGGFVIGYALPAVSRKKASPVEPVFSGVAYSLLGYIIFLVLDYLRVAIGDPLRTLEYPWGRIVFMGAPLLSLTVLVVIAAIVKGAHLVNRRFVWMFIALFGLLQAINIGSFITTYSQVSQAGIQIETGWLALLGIVTTPLTIAVIAYFALENIKERAARLFYATIIATIYAVAMMVIWEFRTDPTAEATTLFSAATTALVFATTTVLILIARKSIAAK